ncbi:MAG: epoxyqueuosine reductase QueH [Bacteroidales bacterium]|nr:epoxyqueuosine reductase QueH [Bacteroidales bacterium]
MPSKTIEIPRGCDRLLLHSCCAPCSGAILEWLLSHDIRPTIFFSNSNIFPQEEYVLRKGEIERYARQSGLEVIDDDYDHDCWLDHTRHLADAPERGERCSLCFRFRLERAAEYAHRHGFKVLTTTLASSRWKDLEQVNVAGTAACSHYDGLLWWGQNWRICGLQERRNEIIRSEGFYNQTYCGCEFSRKNL